MGIDFLTLSAAKGYTEESLQGAGALKGQDGFSPIIEENENNTDKIYKLDVTTADGTFTTPNLKGADGQGGTGGSGEENKIESISVNGENVAIDENKNVDITVPDAYDDTALSNRVKSVEDEIPNLATKTYVGEQIANAEHLKREIVTVLPSDTEASDNIIYMLKVESATGNDKYQEYMKIDGTVQMVGDTSVDLTDYAKKTDIPTTLPANGGNSDTVNNHTVETDVPVDAKFTDTVYDDTEVKESIEELNSNLDTLEYSDVAGGKNIISMLDVSDRNNYELWSGSSAYLIRKYYVKPNTPYVISLDVSSGSGVSVLIATDNGYTDRKAIVLSGTKQSGNIYVTTNSSGEFDLLVSLDTFSDIGINVTNIQVEVGTTATDYEPYIPSVKMLADEVSTQNESLDQLKNDLDRYKPKQYYGKSITIESSGMYLVTATAMGYGAIACTYIVYTDDDIIRHIEKVSSINLTLSESGNVITPSYTENDIYFYVQRIANFWS